MERGQDTDPSVIERIVAEEREAQGKLPKYPGLERWTLLEKMGDGAFSNVYRARDNTGKWDEVAIKVVRKFEMNSTQVSNSFEPVHFHNRPTILSTECLTRSVIPCGLVIQAWPPFDYNTIPIPKWCIRATTTFIRISKSNQRLWRCAWSPSLSHIC